MSTNSDHVHDEAVNTEMAVVDAPRCLDMFLAASEENPVRFATAFTALNTQQRMKLLLKLDSTSTTEEGMESREHARVVELLDALDSEKLRVGQEQSGLHLPAAVKAAAKACGLLQSAGEDGLEDLEVLDLSEETAVHVGALASIFDATPLNNTSRANTAGNKDSDSSGRHAYDVSPPPKPSMMNTTFDNFFNENDDCSRGEAGAVTGFGGTRPSQERDWTGVVPPALDDFLAVDSDEGIHKDGSPRQMNGLSGAAVETVRLGLEPKYHTDPCDAHPSKRDKTCVTTTEDGDGDVDTDSDASVELPGLDVEPSAAIVEGIERTAIPRGPDVPPPSTALVTELRAVVEADDDCVHAFALDPMFDYEKDLLGAAFREQAHGRP